MGVYAAFEDCRDTGIGLGSAGSMVGFSKCVDSLNFGSRVGLRGSDRHDGLTWGVMSVGDRITRPTSGGRVERYDNDEVGGAYVGIPIKRRERQS